MAEYIGKVQIGANGDLLPIGSTLYGTATWDSTNNRYNANSGNLANIEALLDGLTVHIKFSGYNIHASPTLKVGSFDAKPIHRTAGTAVGITAETSWPNNAIVTFTYDGTAWVINSATDNNTTYTFSEGTTNGSFNVAVNGGTAAPVAVHGLSNAAYKDIVSDIGANTSSTDVPTAAAVVSYVIAQTGGLSGLTGAMHFRGTSTVAIQDGDGPSVNPTITGYTFNGNGDNAGDVVLYSGKEFVWTGTTWELLGDEGSYALKSSTDTITEVGTFTANTLPQLTITPTSIPNVTSAGTAPSLTVTPVSIPNVTDVGSRTEASVAAGVLTITLGAVPTLGTAISVGSASNWSAGSTATLGTAISVGSASDWNAGSQAALTTNDTTVVVPTAPAQNP